MLTRRNLLSATAAAAAAFSTDTAHACSGTPRLYRPNDHERQRMREWMAAFRARYNRDATRHPSNWGERLSLRLYDENVQDELVAARLRAFRQSRGRFLTPVDGESTVFVPEAAKIVYLTSTEFEAPRAEDDFDLCGGPGGGHEWLAVKVRFDVDQRTNRLNILSSLVEIGRL